jgi:hypothetical protein
VVSSRRIVAAAAVATSLLAVPLGDVSDPAESVMVLQSREHDGYPPQRFELHGKSVRGLYPGVTKRMDVTIVNPNNFDLRIGSVRGRVTATSHKRCVASAMNLRVGDYTGPLPVVIKSRKRLTLKGSIPVVMPSGAAQACAGVRFTISLVGTAAKASR